MFYIPIEAYIAAKEYREKRVKEASDTRPKPNGAEGVANVNGEYMWCNFTNSTVYHPILKAWTGYVILPSDIVADFRKVKSVEREVPENRKSPENSGLSCNYYVVDIKQPTSVGVPYTAECNDITETLGMTATEANIFKEIWRTAAARTLGKEKAGHNAKRGAEKVAFFGLRYALQNNVPLADLTKTLEGMKVDV
ncbi:hypothetical protein vBAmePR8F_gp18 [Alteromonas phage vB_AmeP_R8W]|uniref:Uncharacterized protein n=1 Tax=Alteromonas phage vB_AmeP_R8W TaxID=2774152 RepID=A0A8E4W6F6_9CAUD|nr:hypothetical protein vBAmePR8F_gp18 [Alteromonas phage vB_AmeP_R8W]